jgi:UDP-glucose 4-epimerase
MGEVTWLQSALSFDALSSLAGETGMPDTVYHLAGGSSVGQSFADPYGDFSATVATSATLLHWLRTNAPNSRVVIVSSAAVYGDIHSGPIGDEAATAPYSPYGAHKFAMEAVCRGWSSSFGLQIVLARLFSVYGPGLTKQLWWDLSGRLTSKMAVVPLGGTGNELRDWTHVSDVVRALTTIVQLASPEMPVVNVGTGNAVSVCAIAEALARAYGRDPACLSFSDERRAGDPFSLVSAKGRLQSLDFEWRETLDRSIIEYAKWYISRSQE